MEFMEKNVYGHYLPVNPTRLPGGYYKCLYADDNGYCQEMYESVSNHIIMRDNFPIHPLFIEQKSWCVVNKPSDYEERVGGLHTGSDGKFYWTVTGRPYK